jgi:leader peptidase (prepilin peptidase)/N-methyltransferase
VFRHVLFALLGLACGWALDHFGWTERIRDRRPASSAVLMASFAGAGFAAASVAFSRSAIAALTGSFIALMGALALIDAVSRILPNRLLRPAGAAYALAVPLISLFVTGLHPVTGLIGLLGYGGSLLLVNLISPSGMGMGDVKLAALIGFVLGSLRLEAVWVAALSGVFAGGLGAVVALVVFRAGRRGTIPYGPFLAAGAVLAVLTLPRLG